MSPRRTHRGTEPRDLNPTAKRVQVAAAIHRGEVHSYGWTEKAWWQTAVDEEVVTRWVNDLRRCRLAEKPAGEVPADKVQLRLTEAGHAWWRRHDRRPTTTTPTTSGAL